MSASPLRPKSAKSTIGFEDQNDNGDEEEENIAVEKMQTWYIHGHVYDKVITVSCGEAYQRVKWLANVIIARWDEKDNQGWKRLGIPTVIRLHKVDGEEIDMSATIRDVINNQDHVFVETSLSPSLTK